MKVRGAMDGVRSAVPGAWCLVLGAVRSAGGGVLSAGGGVLSAAGGAVLGAGGAVPSVAAPQPGLPEGATVIRARCLGCHGADLIVSQRLTTAAWGREIDKMVRWGAPVLDSERAPLVAYLAEHAGPAPVAAHSPTGQGEAIFTRACLACHGTDLVEPQRLSHAAWTREVDKMIRWGARVSDAEKPALVDFLAGRYPPVR